MAPFSSYTISLLPTLGINCTFDGAIVLMLLVWLVVNVALVRLFKKISKPFAQSSREFENLELIQAISKLPFAGSLVVLFILALAEEIFFRMGLIVFLVFLLSLAMGLTPIAVLIAAVASSALFAIAHNQCEHPLAAVILFVNGMIFSFGYLLTGNIWAIVIIHCLVNAFTVLAKKEADDDTETP